MTKKEQIVAGVSEFPSTNSAAAFFGVKPSTIERYLREARQADKPVPAPRITGVIGDTHCPFDHPRYAEFCEDTFSAAGVTDVVHIGDLVDNHAISRHVSEPDGMGAAREYAHAIERVAEYTRRFPNLTLCIGNHCSIPARQARELGIPAMFLRDMHDTWKLPATWEVCDDVEIGGVLYKHGMGASGALGAIRSAIRSRMSVVQGHCHSFGSVHYNANSTSLIFGLNVGCGIDTKAYAFRYGKFIENKPTIGCGIVHSSSHAEFVPMNMEEYK